jgi:hypothetical protein
MKSKKNKYFMAVLLFISAFGFLGNHSPSRAATTAVSVGSALEVTPDSIYPLTIPWSGLRPKIIDSPLTTFVSGGKRYWFNSRSLAQTKYQGSLSVPFQNFLWSKESHLFFSDPQNKLGGPYTKINDLNWTYGGGAPWIVNLYQAADTELLAFIHIEQGALVNGNYSTGASSLGLAYSNNAGESFIYLGNIIEYQRLRDEYNMQGVPYFIKDGYFYIYYHDLCPGAATTVARAPVTEVMQAARRGNVSSWKKYNLGTWDSNGLGGACTKVNIETGIDHTDAMYSTHTGKYYLLLSRAGNSLLSTWIKLYESTDGINWTFIKNIVEELNTVEGGYQYVSVVDSTGRDNSQVGESFFVYSAKNIRNASVYRWQVNLSNISSTAAPLPTPVITPRLPTQPPSPEGKSGDVNGDGFINVIDVGIVIDNYGRNPFPNPKSDLNMDGLVNILDIGLIIDNYGK